MSLINRINYRRPEDLANEGIRVALTGQVPGVVVDQIIVTPDGALAAPAIGFLPTTEKFVIVTGYTLSSDSGTPIEVQLGFKKAADPTQTFFRGYVGGTAGTVTRILDLADWRFGDLEYELVVSVTGGNVDYTIDARISYSKVPKGFVQHEGNPEHINAGRFAPEAGLERGSPEY